MKSFNATSPCGIRWALACLLFAMVGSGGALRAEEFPIVEMGALRGCVGIAVDEESQKLYVASALSHGLAVLSVETGTFLGFVPLDPGAYPTGLAYNDGKIYVETSSATLVLRASDQTVLGQFSHTSFGGWPIGDISISRSGDKVCAVSGVSAKLHVIDSETDELTDRINVGSGNTEVSLSPDATRAYLMNPEAASVTVVDLEQGEVLATKSFLPSGASHSRFHSESVVDASGQVFVSWVTSDSMGRVSILSTEGDLLRTIALPAISMGLTLSRDERFLVTGAGIIVDISTEEVVVDLPLSAPADSRVVFADGGDLALISHFGRSHVTKIAGFRSDISVSASSSEAISLGIAAPVGERGKLYQLAASYSKDNGIPLSLGRQFPLDYDSLLTLSLSDRQAFEGFGGFLDHSASAEATVRFVGLPSRARGKTVYVAFATFDGSRRQRDDVRFLSEPFPITIAP